jgi:hypothetical protein
MPVRQALNMVYAQCMTGLDAKERKEFVDSLYGFSEMNRAGNNALQDFRAADEAVAGGDT